MANVLYVKVNPKRDEESQSSQLAKYYLELYKENKKGDVIDKLDLYESEIPFLDVDVFSAWGKFASQTTLTKTEQNKADQMDKLTNQFLNADKLIFAAPFWNLGYPPMLKAYIDTICIAGKTFKYTDKEPVGLVSDKPLLLIETRSGFYSDGPTAELENSQRYLRTIMGFMGVKNFTSVIAENLYVDEEHQQESIKLAKQQLQDIADRF